MIWPDDDDDDKVDLPVLLTAILRHINPREIEKGFTSQAKSKNAENSKTGKRVPSEAVYADQLHIIIRQALLKISPDWEYDFEAKGEALGASDHKLDILLTRPALGTAPELRVGIELTASVQKSSLDKRANRNYAERLNLDQFIILNFTPNKHKFTYFCDGNDKNGKSGKIPVFNVWHNETYTDVTLFYQDEHDKLVEIKVI